MTQETNLRQESYNKFELYPDIAYNCVSLLIEKEDMLWKLLKYPTPDAWSKPNLTKQEKGALIYDGSPNETDFRVFLDTAQDNAWTIQACILRISPLTLIPVNYIYGNLSLGFEIYSHYSINHLSNYKTRLDVVAQRIIETMNGSEVKGLGRLYFDAKASSSAKSFVIGSIPYKGRIVVMCNWIV